MENVFNSIKALEGQAVCQFCGKPCKQLEVFFDKLNKKITIPACSCQEIKEKKNQDRKRLLKTEDLFYKSLIPKDSWQKRLLNFPFSLNETEKQRQEYMIKSCKKFVSLFPNNKGIWLTLWGGVGTGKSETSKIVTLKLIKDHLVKAIYINAKKLCEQLKTGIPEKGILAKETKNYYMSKDIIVIDELGGEDKFERSALFSLINDLYDYKKTLITNSNLILPEESDNFYKRFWSRGQEPPSIQIPFQWGDLRRKHDKTNSKNIL